MEQIEQAGDCSDKGLASPETLAAGCTDHEDNTAGPMLLLPAENRTHQSAAEGLGSRVPKSRTRDVHHGSGGQDGRADHLFVLFGPRACRGALAGVVGTTPRRQSTNRSSSPTRLSRNAGGNDRDALPRSGAWPSPVQRPRRRLACGVSGGHRPRAKTSLTMMKRRAITDEACGAFRIPPGVRVSRGWTTRQRSRSRSRATSGRTPQRARETMSPHARSMGRRDAFYIGRGRPNRRRSSSQRLEAVDPTAQELALFYGRRQRLYCSVLTSLIAYCLHRVSTRRLPGGVSRAPPRGLLPHLRRGCPGPAIRPVSRPFRPRLANRVPSGPARGRLPQPGAFAQRLPFWCAVRGTPTTSRADPCRRGTEKYVEILSSRAAQDAPFERSELVARSDR